MTAIWQNDGKHWSLMEPTGFPDEATLHRLIEQAPQLLPLAGTPQLTVVGREVALGTGYADLIAVEPSGRIVIIEIKLARNAEARRAVIAQILTYAAYLDGMAQTTFERDVLGKHLAGLGYDSLSAAVDGNDQQGSFNPSAFAAGLEESLKSGRFRLVIVLDRAPDELVRLVDYLSKVAEQLLIDLVTVATYDVAGSQIVVPQRVEPERRAEALQAGTPGVVEGGETTDGSSDWMRYLESARADQRDKLQRLARWAEDLRAAGLCTLRTYTGAGRKVMLPRVIGDSAGLVSVATDGGGCFWLFRSVFERLAPEALARLEQLIAPVPVKQGNTLKQWDEDVLAVLTDAYKEARATKSGNP